MKKITLLFAGLALLTITAQAQTADEIINKYADAMGGKQKISEIKNVYMEGSQDFGGTQLPIKIWIVNKKSFRAEFTFNGMTGYQIIRNDSGWVFAPFQGQTHPEPMTAEQVKRAQPQLEAGTDDDLLNYKAKGYKATMEGKDDVDGTEAFKIELVINDSLKETYFFDPETYYVIRVHTKATTNGQVKESDQDLSDYKKTDYGVVFPMSMGGSGQGGEIKLTTVKVNTDIDNKLFSPSN